MLLDYQQGGMVLDGLLTFPDWAYGGSVAEETNQTTGGTIQLQGSAAGLYAGRVVISLEGGRQPQYPTSAEE